MKKMIIKYWEGKYTLAQSYWIGCILIPIVLILPLLPAFMGNAATMSSALIWFTLIYWGALFFVNMFLIIGAFKSATIYRANKKKKKQNGGWGLAAQIFLVLGAINIFFQYIKVFVS